MNKILTGIFALLLIIIALEWLNYNAEKETQQMICYNSAPKPLEPKVVGVKKNQPLTLDELIKNL